MRPWLNDIRSWFSSKAAAYVLPRVSYAGENVTETVRAFGLSKQKRNGLLPAGEPFGILVSLKAINTLFEPIPTNELQNL